MPEVWLFFPDVLSNGIELDATEPPVLETLQNINPINHVVQAVYSIPRKSTLSVSLGNALRCRVESPLQEHDPLRSEYRTCPARLKPKLRLCQRRALDGEPQRQTTWSTVCVMQVTAPVDRTAFWSMCTTCACPRQDRCAMLLTRLMSRNGYVMECGLRTWPCIALRRSPPCL